MCVGSGRQCVGFRVGGVCWVVVVGVRQAVRRVGRRSGFYVTTHTFGFGEEGGERETQEGRRRRRGEERRGEEKRERAGKYMVPLTTASAAASAGLGRSKAQGDNNNNNSSDHHRGGMMSSYNVSKAGSEAGGSSTTSFHQPTGGAFAQQQQQQHPGVYPGPSVHSPWGVHPPPLEIPTPAPYSLMEPMGDVQQWCSPGGYMLQPHSPGGVPPPYGSITPTSPPNGHHGHHHHHHHHHHPPPAYRGCYLAPYPGLPAAQACNPGGMEAGMPVRGVGKRAGEEGGKSRRGGCLRDEFDKPASLLKAVEASKKLGQPGPARWFNSQGFPLRTGKPDCKHYISKAWCLYGTMCKFNHPEPGLSAVPPMPAPYHPSHVPPPPTGHSPQSLIPAAHWGGAPAPYFWTPWGGMMARGYVMGAPYYPGVVYRTGSVDSAVSSLSNINGGDSDRASDEGGVIDSATSCGHWKDGNRRSDPGRESLPPSDFSTKTESENIKYYHCSPSPPPQPWTLYTEQNRLRRGHYWRNKTCHRAANRSVRIGGEKERI